MSLMGLPSELRARIIEFVLFHRRERPNAQSQLPLHGRRIHPDDVSLCMQDQRGTFYEDDEDGYAANWRSLLLVNHLLNCETRNRVAVFQSKLSYELDILVDKDRNLLPTWISFPLLPRDVSSLDVTIRISRPEGLHVKEPDVWGKYSKESPSIVSYELFMILSRLLKEGPNPTFRGKEQRSPMIISTLKINVEPTSAISETCTGKSDCPAGKIQQDFLLNCSAQDRYAQRDMICAAHPECFCAWMGRQLEHLLGLTGDFGLCGLKSTTSIGLIQLRYNSSLWREFDLGQIIVDFSPLQGSEIYHRLSQDEEAAARFEKQRADMIVLRRSRDLPTPESSMSSES